MTALQAIIFDVDGTLAENERDGHRVAFNQAFKAAGLDWFWSEDLYGDLLEVAGGKERMRFFLKYYSPPLPESVSNSPDFIAELHRIKTQRYVALVKAGKIQLRPGVKRLIMEAREAGVRLAIATTSQLENALALLETTFSVEAVNWFDVIAAGDIVPKKKPAPDIYRYVLTKTGWSAERCIAIEDTTHGLTAADDAGLTTVATVNRYTRYHDFSKARLVINHLGEPNQPCLVLRGEALQNGYFDVEIATSLLFPNAKT